MLLLSVDSLITKVRACGGIYMVHFATVVCRELNDQGLRTITLRAWSQYI